MYELQKTDSFVKVLYGGKGLFDAVFSYGISEDKKAEQVRKLMNLIAVGNASERSKKPSIFRRLFYPKSLAHKFLMIMAFVLIQLNIAQWFAFEWLIERIREGVIVGLH